MAVVHVKTAESYRQMIAANKLVVIDFFAALCGACQDIAPKFEECSIKYPQVSFLKVVLFTFILCFDYSK